MDKLDKLEVGDVVYVPDYGFGIVYDHFDYLEEYFRVVFHDEEHTYTATGDLCVTSFDDCPYDKDTSVSRIDKLTGRSLTTATPVYNFIHGIGFVIACYPPERDGNDGSARVYFSSSDSNIKVGINGYVRGMNGGVDLYNSVFPMNSFRPFNHSTHSKEVAVCKSALSDLTERYVRMRNRLRDLGEDISDYTV